jgi:hypothetical protein
MWYDDAGELHVGFSRNSDVYEAALNDAVHLSDVVHAVPVQRSWNELVSIQERIDSQMGQLKTVGVDITGTALLPDRNKLKVWVSDLNNASAAAILALVEPGVVELGERANLRVANRDNVGPPWVGGMSLLGPCTYSTDCLLAGCSANFVIYSYIQEARFYSILTAGHCFDMLGQVTTGSGVRVGTVVRNMFYKPGSRADAEEITVDPLMESYKIIGKDPAQHNVVALKVTQVLNEQSICKSGITTDQTCSWTISAVHATEVLCLDPSCSTEAVIFDQVEATRSSPGVNYGDSGGPVYKYETGGVRAHGIVSAMNQTGTLMTYSFLSSVLLDMDAYVCLSWDC